jgi:hypothetical protein
VSAGILVAHRLGNFPFAGIFEAIMKRKGSLVLLSLLLLASTSVLAQSEAPSKSTIPVLHNSDVLRMYMQGLGPGVIISKIVSSNCNFDVFPPVMWDLRRRGLPDTVLMAMTMVPYGPPSAVIVEKDKAALAVPVQIPAGTIVRLEAARAVSSAEIAKGQPINFQVTHRVIVNGVVVIERGAVARARIVQSKPGRGWGRAGMLEFALEDVVAVDGTQIRIQLSKQVKGASRTKAVTAAAIITGAIALPYSPPVALFWALKKGDDAVLDQRTKLVAVVNSVQTIAVLPPEKKRIIYHAVNTLNAAVPAQGTGFTPSSKGFRPTSIRHK